MQADVLNLKGKKVKTIELPEQFSEPFHPNLIKRAVLTMQANKRQPYGAYTEAGKRASAKLSRRRKEYKTAYGYGISRIPRKILSRRGRRFNWAGAVAPGTVAGRRAHPPKATKILSKNINKKERKKAIRSALAATINEAIVQIRENKLKTFPLIVEAQLESLTKTKDVIKTLHALGLDTELVRIEEKKIRAGKGKRRGRKYVKKKGPLIVVSESCAVEHAAKNVPGIDICKVNLLNAELLAPGATPGRLTIYTDKSIEKMRSESLFM